MKKLLLLLAFVVCGLSIVNAQKVNGSDQMRKLNYATYAIEKFYVWIILFRYFFTSRKRHRKFLSVTGFQTSTLPI